MPTALPPMVVLLLTGVVLTSLAGGGSAGAQPAREAKVAFSRGDINVGTSIWTVNDDGTDLAQVTNPPTAARDDEPAWSPDRSQIAFVRALVVDKDFRGDNVFREFLSVMNADGSELRQLAVHAHDLAWSSDGSLIAFVKNYAEDGWIWTIKPDGTTARRLARGGQPTWSPDGRRIAFSRYLGGTSVGEVFVMNANGTGQHRLLDAKYESQQPDWSPDGRRIAFLAFSDHGLYTVRVDGRGPRRLAGGVSSMDTAKPTWSPDGSRLLFDRERAGGGGADFVYVIRSGGGGLRRVATNAWFPDWSPDGGSIVYAGSSRGLRIVSATGGASKRIAREEARYVDW